MHKEVTLISCLLMIFCITGVSCAPQEGGAPQTGDVTLAVINARIWTGDSSQPWAEALAANGERLVAVGPNAQIEEMSGGAQVIDAGGRLLVPGFIDTHVHFLQGGFGLSSVQLRDATTPEEFTARIKAFAATVPPGTWIEEGTWDHERWGGELPRRDWIDAVTPEHPVWVGRLDGHMALANSVALEAAGITKDTEDVEGGTIVRYDNGEPTGILKDNAMGLVYRVIPEPSPEMKDRALDAAMKHVNQQGVTSVTHVGSWDHVETFARAREAGRLTTRVYAGVPLANWERLRDTVAAGEYGGPDGCGDVWLRIGGMKGFVDGSLGSHTAAFFEPYTETP